MIVAIAAVIAGVGLLAVASDQFVVGAARIASLRNLPPLIVGVVIIGFGTSSPELLVSVLAAIDDEPGVAIGNVVGSNLANLTLLMGVGATIVTLHVDSRTVRREATLVILATVGFGIAVQGGGIERWEGVLLLIAMAAVLVFVTRGDPGDPIDELAIAAPGRTGMGVESVRVVLGLVGTVAGAQALLFGALELADRAGLSAGFVGATLVAVGTSLPELVTVIQSARRGEPDLIVGNLLGSNLFNALAVGGAIGIVGGVGIDNPSITTIAVIAAAAAAVVTGVAMRTGLRVSRREGVALVLVYVALVPVLA